MLDDQFVQLQQQSCDTAQHNKVGVSPHSLIPTLRGPQQSKIANEI